ncbi:MAG: hypothetical protein HC921_15680 [Synechococcaceae cyanobacterium SM2_3_1]|nr:hypothetical protein [Synechococcaceae cyanobacterium SM2_3_1]
MQTDSLSFPSVFSSFWKRWGELWVGVGLALCIGLIYYLSTPELVSPFDYTFRMARALLQGQVGLQETPPPYLNEMIPLNGRYYSVFPLGSLLTVLPHAWVAEQGWIQAYPSAQVAGLIAAAIAWVAYGLASHYGFSLGMRCLLVLFLLLGNWTWCNLVFGGAWHLTLGFALLGQLAALYFILVCRIPWLAGLCFALAFGNRTELVLLAPLFLYLLVREDLFVDNWLARVWRPVLAFCLVPFGLGVATLGYNYLRFGSITDFGKSRIPGVLEEPWFADGIFALSALGRNLQEMLLRPWKQVEGFPYFVPTGFGGSIFLASPFLLLLFRPQNLRHPCVIVSWIALGVTTAILWLHGNPGVAVLLSLCHESAALDLLDPTA